MREWDDDQEQWIVEVSGKKLMLKAGNIFAMDGHVAKRAVYELEARWDEYGPPMP